MEKKKREVDYFEYYRRRGDFHKWKNIRHPVRVLKNFIIATVCRSMPDMKLKSMLYRKMGVKIGKNVSLLGVKIDIFFPDLIEIGDNTLIGQDTMIVTHEFLGDHWKKGRIKIGKNVMIGTLCLILPGVEIGDNTTVAAYSLVNKDVKPNAFVGGVPAKEIKR
jgi:acetyltransferase-like isoleucine patch superfamily enzyme